MALINQLNTNYTSIGVPLSFNLSTDKVSLQSIGSSSPAYGLSETFATSSADHAFHLIMSGRARKI